MSKRSKSLPLDGPRWFALQAAIEQRQELAGELPLAITDLTQDMVSTKLRVMRIHLATGKREHVEPTFMRDHEMVVFPPTGEVTVLPRIGEARFRSWEDPLRDHAYYVWKPDLDKLYGGASGAPARPERNSKRQRAAGGGAKPVLSDDVIERGKHFFREELVADLQWRSSKVQACSLHVKESQKLTSHWQTVAKWIVKPVMIEQGLLRPARAKKTRSKNKRALSKNKRT